MRVLAKRYSNKFLESVGSHGLLQDDQFFGSVSAILREERRLIEEYLKEYGELPPGNTMRK